MVPEITVDVDLDVTHTALRQAPRHQAALAVRISGVIADAVHFACGVGFLGDVQRVAGLHLHARRQLVAGNTCVKLRFSRMVVLVNLIETGQQIARQTDHVGRLLDFGFQVQNGRTVGLQPRALIKRREKTRLPGLHAIDGQSRRIV